MSNYEYGIWLNGTDTSDLHRTGMTKDEAETWLREWEEMAPDAKPHLFSICRRPMGEWEVDVDGEFYVFVRE